MTDLVLQALREIVPVTRTPKSFLPNGPWLTCRD